VHCCLKNFALNFTCFTWSLLSHRYSARLVHTDAIDVVHRIPEYKSWHLVRWTSSTTTMLLTVGDMNDPAAVEPDDIPDLCSSLGNSSICKLKLWGIERTAFGRMKSLVKSCKYHSVDIRKENLCPVLFHHSRKTKRTWQVCAIGQPKNRYNTLWEY